MSVRGQSQGLGRLQPSPHPRGGARGGFFVHDANYVIYGLSPEYGEDLNERAAGRPCHLLFRGADTPCPGCALETHRCPEFDGEDGEPSGLDRLLLLEDSQLPPRDALPDVTQLHVKQILPPIPEEIEVPQEPDVHVQTAVAALEAQRRFSLFVQHASDGISIVDVDGRTVDWNQAMESITGIARAAALGRPPWELMAEISHPRGTALRALPRWEEEFRRAINTGEAPWLGVPQMVTIRRPDGALRQIEQTSFAMETKHGWQIGTIVRDRSEAVERDRSLHALKARYRTVAENLPDGALMLYDHDLRYRLVQGQIFSRLSRDPDPLLGLRPSDFLDAPTAEVLEEHYARTLKGEARSFEVEVWDNVFAVHTLPIFGSDGGVEHGLVLAQTVTERKRIEEALRESEDKFRSIFEASLDGIFLIDLEGRYVDVNPAGSRMMGYGHGELVGRTIHDLLPEDYVPKTLTRTEEVWEEGLTLPQIPLRHKEGGTVFVEMNVSGLTVDGQRRLLGITRDITRRLEDERARVKTHLELQQKANELERFTFMNSHDLRNPLITIQSFLGVVENQLDSNAREQNADSFARIRDATGTMHQLLDEMMNFSRTGWRQLRVERVQPRLLIELVLAELAHDLEEAEVTVRGHYPPLTGDRSRLEVLFKNLVENAVKFRHPERPLRLEIEGSVRQNRLAITIRDNGVGIEPRFHNRVFELFEQLNVDTPGSGIGLALARRIVEQHGGRIGLEAEEDRKGLTLHMELPIAGPGEEEMHDQSEEVQP